MAAGEFVELKCVFVLTTLSVVLSACAELPSSGPTAKQIISASAPADEPSQYEVIDINVEVAEILRKSVRRASGSGFSELPLSPARGIGIGDSLSVTVFESSSGGLFSAKSQSDGTANGTPNVVFPPQTVDRTGTITVPYAGNISVVGLSPQQVQKKIESRLSKRAIEPQAIVTIVGNESRLVTVSGDVTKGGRVPLNTGNERLLDALALAGGPKGTAQDTYIKLTRGKSSGDMLLERLINSPQENVPLQPRDQIFVYSKPQKFVALGANLTNAEVKFESASLTLAEALGRAGGLNDERADPAGVFVFRYESVDVYHSIGGRAATGDREIPIVYRLDLKSPGGFLAAQRFPIIDKDVVYFANSPSTELSKFFLLIGRGFTASYGGVSTVTKLNP